jgi:holin-like protein
LCLLDHPEFFGSVGLKLFAVILLGTLIVMVVTAVAVDLCYRWMLTRSSYAKL